MPPPSKTSTGTYSRGKLPHLQVRNFGPVKAANITFGNLTVLVGPQASGKSILLQLLKLLVDTAQVKYEFRRAGVDWENDFDLFLDVYFGEGMRRLFRNKSEMHLGPRTGELKKDGKVIYYPSKEQMDLRDLVAKTKPRKQERLFFVPAQRVLTLRGGWPDAFSYYEPGVPFTVREFSEELRLLMTDAASDETLFPVPRRLKQEYRELLKQHLFPGFDLKIDSNRAQKRLVLSAGEEGGSLPFMVWSAGQREFVPLLLSLYHLLTPAKSPRRKGVEWVVIEELEMGLHPRAISVVMLMIFELMQRGYRVCISTHSPQVLEAVWALKHLRASNANGRELLRAFDAPQTQGMIELAGKVLMQRANVYYFDRASGTTRDISNLDPSDEIEGNSGWGGLSEFSGRVNEVVARAVANAGRKTAP
jgi:energy-coupling factor transporter ATP-binding protein EcfA2